MSRAKKGQLGFGLAMAAAVAGAIFFIGLVILGLVLAQLASDSNYRVYGSATTAVNGEQITLINGTAVAVARNLVNPGSWAIYNGSNNLGLGNFTLNNVSGTVTLKTTNTIPQYNNTLVSVNYTYDNTANIISGDGNYSKVVDDGKVSMSNFSGLGKVLVYILFLVVVIGMFAVVGYGAYHKLKD